MDIRDDYLKRDLHKEQKMNKFYSKLAISTFKANLEPNVGLKLAKEAKRLGVTPEEIRELESSIKKGRNNRNKKIHCRYLQSALTQMKYNDELKDRN